MYSDSDSAQKSIDFQSRRGHLLKFPRLLPKRFPTNVGILGRKTRKNFLPYIKYWKLRSWSTSSGSPSRLMENSSSRDGPIVSLSFVLLSFVSNGFITAFSMLISQETMDYPTELLLMIEIQEDWQTKKRYHLSGIIGKVMVIYG